MVKKSNKTKDKTNKRKDNGENKPDRRPENWKRKHGKLLEDPQVREWHKKIARRSLLSADVRLRTLGHYCELMNTTPSEILEHAQTGELKPMFKKFIEKMEYYCSDCASSGKKTIASMECWACSENAGKLVYLCGKCAESEKHEDHLMDDIMN